MRPTSRWTVATVYGLLTTACQVLCLREVHAALRGSELVYGITLAEWLLAAALGAWLGGKLPGRARTDRSTLLFLGLLALAVPAGLVWARAARALLLGGLAAGELASVTHAALFPLAIAGPLALLGGLGFPLVVAAFESAPAPARDAYTGIALGDLLAGLALSLRPVVESLNLRVALWSAAFALLALATLRRSAVAGLALACGFGCLAASLAGRQVAEWELHSVAAGAGRGLRVVGSFNTPQGSLVVTEADGMRSFHHNGELLCSAPSEAVAENIHYPLLTTSLAGGNVLLLGGALSGEVGEVLEYAPRAVDVVELDPRRVEIARLFLPAEWLAPLSDPRVRLLACDARRAVRNVGGSYDAILVLSGSPASLAGNRLFTREFCAEAARRLRPDGVLVLSVPGNANVLGAEEAALAGCLLATLRSAFAQVLVLPGSHLTFVARREAAPLLCSGREAVAARLRALDLDNRLVIPETVRWSDQFDRQRIASLRARLEEYDGRLNRDLDPVAAMHATTYWARLAERGGVSGGLRAALAAIDRLPWAAGVAGAAALGLVVWVRARGRGGRWLAAPMLASIAFATMAAEIVLLVAYQALYGYVYERVGLLLALLLGGTAVGSHWLAPLARCEASEPDRAARGLAWAGGGCALLCVLLVPAVSGAFAASMALGEATVLGWALLLGACLGAAYPLAVAASGLDGNPARAGLLYGADLLGAACGALAGAVLLIPARGLPETALCGAALVALWLPGLLTGCRRPGVAR